MEYEKNNKVIFIIKRVLLWITIISVIWEIVLYPSINNLVGIMMTVICYFLFTNLFLKQELIINAPFSFFMLVSMFLYRYLPLIGTILEGKPISYGMVNPIKSFLLETILFVISCLAFYLSTRYIKKANLLQTSLSMLGFYKKSNEKTIWILGGLGLIARIITLAMGSIDTGNVVGKALNVLFYYMYTPVILFFPCLYKREYSKGINFKNKKVWIYIILISIINLATNSRDQLITPIMIVILNIFLTSMIINVTSLLKPKTIIKGVIILIISIFLISNISKSMLINRNIRNNISFVELIKSTYNTLTNGSLEEEWSAYTNKQIISKSYDDGWTESYIDNFLLNRLCNIRITDETLYLGSKLGNNQKMKMREDFKNRIIAVLPQPLINIMGVNFDKSQYYNSRGDKLYVYSGIGTYFDIGGFRVTSHLGDGLATFGILYFIIQFIMWYFVMFLLNSFTINKGSSREYSILGLLSVYKFLLMFSNANGMIDDVLYCLRGYWQEIILFLILFKLARIISLLKLK